MKKLILMGSVLVVLGACSSQSDGEKVEKKIDQAMEQTEKAAEKLKAKVGQKKKELQASEAKTDSIPSEK